MNNRRDEQYGRQQFGRHNEQWDDERYRDRDGNERERAMSGGREGYGGDWRTEGLGGYGEGLRGGYSYVEQGMRGESMRGGPMMGQRRWANEGLSNDFSIEGTRNFSRDERRSNARGWGVGSAFEGEGHVRVSHRGKGPKGFTRSDDRIREDVCQILTDHQDIDATDIEVEVKGGEVTLSGTVIDRWTKRLAEAVVENVSGIVDIHNRVRVVARDTKVNQPSAPVSQGRSNANGDRTTTPRSH
jgi:osmotically-inducible protein OsmY